MNPRIGWSQPPTSWGQPHLPGWAPLVDPGPQSIQTLRSVGRWFWPALSVSGFLVVVAYIVGHDDPAPGLSHRGLLTIALAATVVVLLTIHRRYGPGPLARAVAEYAVAAVLAGLLAGGAGADRQPADYPTPTTAGHAKTQPHAQPRTDATAGDYQPAVVQAGAKVVRAVTGAARALAGAVRWLIDLWHRADQQATPEEAQAMTTPPRSPLPSDLSTWRSP